MKPILPTIDEFASIMLGRNVYNTSWRGRGLNIVIYFKTWVYWVSSHLELIQGRTELNAVDYKFIADNRDTKDNETLWMMHRFFLVDVAYMQANDCILQIKEDEYSSYFTTFIPKIDESLDLDALGIEVVDVNRETDYSSLHGTLLGLIDSSSHVDGSSIMDFTHADPIHGIKAWYHDLDSCNGNLDCIQSRYYAMCLALTAYNFDKLLIRRT